MLVCNLLCRKIKISKYLCRPIFTSKEHYNYDVLHGPHKLSKPYAVPVNIKRPSYVHSTTTSFQSVVKSFLKSSVSTKNNNIINRIRDACRLGRRILNMVRYIIKPGVSTADLDYIAHTLICQHNAYPSPLGYKGFPKSVCTSVNNVVVHGIPDKRKLISGDIVNVDITVFCNGVHGDLSETFLIGNVDNDAKHLVSVTKNCLESAVSICGPGQPLNEIGNVISGIASKQGFSVCPYFVGHGIGEGFHETPQILHHYNDYAGYMETGMVFTIEPVLCEGRPEIKFWKDGWTVVTEDEKRAAQFEHTILITSDGVEVLTIDNPNDPYLRPTLEEKSKIEEMVNLNTDL